MEAQVAREPIHPGEFLQDELTELGMSAAELARSIHVPANRISQILAGKRNISAETALQQAYELDLAQKRLGARLEAIEPRTAA